VIGGKVVQKLKPGELRIQKGASWRCGQQALASRARFVPHASPRGVPLPPLPRLHPRSRADITELDAGSVGRVSWPDPAKLTFMKLSVTPDKGLWAGATFVFSIAVPDMYPHEPPKVLCETKVRRTGSSEGGWPVGSRAAPAAARRSETLHQRRRPPRWLPAAVLQAIAVTWQQGEGAPAGAAGVALR